MDHFLDAGAFSHPEVVTATEDFERVMINCTLPGTDEFETTAEGKRLMEDYGVESWPQVLVLSPDGELIRRVRGCRGPDEWLSILERTAADPRPPVRFGLEAESVTEAGPWRVRIGNVGRRAVFFRIEAGPTPETIHVLDRDDRRHPVELAGRATGRWIEVVLPEHLNRPKELLLLPPRD